jgi:hypothetical protein
MPTKRPQYVLLAHYFYMRLWELSLKSIASYLVRARTAQQAASAATQLQQRQARSVTPPLISQPPSATAAPLPSTPVPVIYPANMQQWVDWQPPEAIRKYFKSSTDKNIINSTSMENSHISYYYMNMLVELLESCGYHLHCVPIFYLMEVVSTELIQNPHLSSLIFLRLAKLFETMNMHGHSKKMLHAAYGGGDVAGIFNRDMKNKYR